MNDYKQLRNKLTENQMTIVEIIYDAYKEDIGLMLNKDASGKVKEEDITLDYMNYTYREYGCELMVLKWFEGYISEERLLRSLSDFD